MKLRVRTVLQFVPIALQFFAMAAAIGIVSFIAPVTQRLIKETESSVAVPAPTKLFVENAGVAKMIMIALFLASVLSIVCTRVKIKEDADRLLVQSVVLSIVWYVGIMLLGGIVMAALLPYFAMVAAAQ